MLVKDTARDVSAVADDVGGDVVVEVMGDAASPQRVRTDA